MGGELLGLARQVLGVGSFQLTETPKVTREACHRTGSRVCFLWEDTECLRHLSVTQPASFSRWRESVLVCVLWGMGGHVVWGRPAQAGARRHGFTLYCFSGDGSERGPTPFLVRKLWPAGLQSH